MTRMKKTKTANTKNKKITALIGGLLALVLMLPVGLAFFEYFGENDLLIDVNGKINQNAFDVLNSEDYRAEEFGYGTTPENPFVINNLDRLYNLIRLTNTGKIKSSKIAGGVFEVDQYYFVLNFTKEPTPQVLDLDGTVIESVGNNDYPFVDTLSGLIYAYCYDETEKKYIYLSGLTQTVDVEISGGEVKIDGVVTETTGGSLESGKYIKVPSYYVQIQDGDTISPVGTSDVYVPISTLRPIHNVIANAVVSVPDEQIDVGFFSHIAVETHEGTSGDVTIRGSVSDFILYNITVEAKESVLKSVWNAIKSVWESLFGTHNKQPEYSGDENGYYERHIGLFAGHIDGDVDNITVAGEGRLDIKTKDVNYYSRFATAGYIDDGAIIGKHLFSDIIGAGIGMTKDLGCFFADSIFAVANGEDGEDTGYPIKDIPNSPAWGGVETVGGGYVFKQGAFRFVLSDENDEVRKIWNGGGEIKLLNAEGYSATKSVLYCNDEYRYSSTSQAGGSLTPGAASSNETKYQGAYSLVATGSMLDKGKYVIAAKVPDGDGFTYHALKIEAAMGANNEVIHSFDSSLKSDITDYINGSQSSIYSSAVWQTTADSSEPKFRNDRFITEFLAVNDQTSSGGGVTKNLTRSLEDAGMFSYNVRESAFYYKTEKEDETSEGGLITVYYYLNYTEEDGFFFSTEKVTEIEVYRLSNGFRTELVTNINDITEHDDYFIVASSGSSLYLLGEEADESGETGVIVATGNIGDDYMFGEMPSLISLEEYNAYRQYVWYTSSAGISGGTASVSFYDKLSGRYFLSAEEGLLSLSPQEYIWSYQTSSPGGRLYGDGYYLSHQVAQGGGFRLSGSAYNIYLYKLIPEDASSSYNTYMGANLVDSQSSSVEAGEYIIAADTTSSHIGLVMTGESSLGSLDVSGFIDGSGDMSELVGETGSGAGYKWLVGNTTDKPAFKNIAYGSYFWAGGSGDNIGLFESASGKSWMYDSVAGRLYFAQSLPGGGEALYFLSYFNGGFLITEGDGEYGHNYNIRLYKLTYEYTYSDVTPVSSIAESDTLQGQSPQIYFLTTNSLTELESKSTYVLGAKGTSNESAVTSVNISPNSVFNSSQQTLVTREDLSYYEWYIEPRILPGFPANIYATTKTGSYFPAFQFKNGVTGMYLAASSSPNSRTLVAATTPNMNASPGSGSSQAENNDGAMTAIGFGQGNSTTRSNPNGRILHTDGTTSIYVMGRSAGYEYYIWTTATPGVFALSTFGEQPAAYGRPYLYKSSGLQIDIYVEAVSEKGDNLDAGIHYMIAAKAESAGGDQYYAIGEQIDENGQKRISGINVTAQAETINNSVIYDEHGNIIETHSTDTLRMVPIEADWVQTSTEKGLVFYQSFYSTNAVREYLTVEETPLQKLATKEIPVVDAEKPVSWYYDAISKYFKYYSVEGGVETCYFLYYDLSGDVFGFTTDKTLATHFYIYRFKPTYVVTQVTSGNDESLKSGNFIIANLSGSTYTAIGVDETDVISKNVTDYIASPDGFRDDLSETEYNEILGFILKQQYYDFNSDAYNPNSPSMQLFSYITGGGFTVDYNAPGLQTGSDPMVWALSRSGSNWTFKNKNAISNVGANARGIAAGNVRSYLKITDGVAVNMESITRYAGAKLYTYNTSNRTLTPATSISTSSTYYCVVLTPVIGTHYLLYISGSSLTIQLVALTQSGQNLVASSDLSNNYQFTASLRGSNYRLVSRSSSSRYLAYNATTRVFSSGSSNYNWRVNSQSELLYSGNPSGTSFTFGDGNIYLYKHSGAQFTRIETLTAGGTYAAVMRESGSGNYLLIGYSGSELTLTLLGTSLPASIPQANVSLDKRLSPQEGGYGVHLGFEGTNLFISLSVSGDFELASGKTTELRYLDNKLYTVTNSPAPLEFIRTSNGTAITFAGSFTAGTAIPEAWFYEAVPNGSGGFTLTKLESTELAEGKDVIILLSYSNGYRAINRNGANINLATVNASLSNATANMVWRYENGTLSFMDGSVKKYLRRAASGLVIGSDKDIEFFSFNYATYAFTANSSSGTSLYIFRVDQSSEVDEVTDLDSMLSSKARLIPTISLLESSKYIVVAKVTLPENEDKYYSLGMMNTNTTLSLDITDVMRRSDEGKGIVLFDAAVWEQRGSDTRLVFDNFGFGGDDGYNLLTGARGGRDSMEVVVEYNETFPAGQSLDDYTWRAYTFEDGSHLFGFTEDDGETRNIFYLFFDFNELKFKLTTSFVTAKNQYSYVSLYQLGEKTTIQPEFKTSVIKTDDSGVIISYPINIAETESDLKTYSSSGSEDLNGEYLIIAELGQNYYALTLDENSRLSYVDVAPYFSGNYSLDAEGRYCLSFNHSYVWQQTNIIISGAENPSLVFKNAQTGASLGGGANYHYDFAENQLYTANGIDPYLVFDPDGGFSYGAGMSEIKLFLYQLGESGVEFSGTGTLNYTYYSIPLGVDASSGVDFTRFSFNKKHLGELISFAAGENDLIEKSLGWRQSEGVNLAEITSSVIFAKGISYDGGSDDPALDFAGEFVQNQTPFAVTDELTGDTMAGVFNYLAPKGSASFVISEASPQKPVFVNLVASTEFDSLLNNPDYLRFLCLWKVGELDFENGLVTPLKKYTGASGGRDAVDYAYTLAQKLNTPDYAIPLPNLYGSEASKASYARVDGDDYILSSGGYNECLIAHTFVITKPGLYYLGANYGSVAFSYISIDNIAEGETDSGISSGAQLSIDFCYGGLDTETAFAFAAESSDEVLSDLCYVGSEGYFHSQIFPAFVSGNGHNLTDGLDMRVVRVYDDEEDVSRVLVQTFTNKRLSGGIVYSNNNTLSQRQKQKVAFSVYAEGLSVSPHSLSGAFFWTAVSSDDDDAELFTLFTSYNAGGVEKNFFLGSYEDNLNPSPVPMLIYTGKHFWQCQDGLLINEDGLYLTYSGSALGLSASPENGIQVFSVEAGVTSLAGSFENGKSYILVTLDLSTMVSVSPDADISD